MKPSECYLENLYNINEVVFFLESLDKPYFLEENSFLFPKTSVPVAYKMGNL